MLEGFGEFREFGDVFLEDVEVKLSLKGSEFELEEDFTFRGKDMGEDLFLCSTQDEGSHQLVEFLFGLLLLFLGEGW